MGNLDTFKKYLKNNNVKYLDVKNKIKIEALWNELIISKFSSKIQISTFLETSPFLTRAQPVYPLEPSLASSLVASSASVLSQDSSTILSRKEEMIKIQTTLLDNLEEAS